MPICWKYASFCGVFAMPIYREANLQVTNPRTEPRVTYCAREQLKGTSRYGPIIRKAIVIECNERGKGSVIINGKEFSFGPQQCYVLFPGDTVVHLCDGEDPRGGMYCFLDGLELSHHFRAAGLSSESPFLPSQMFPHVQRLLGEMLTDYSSRDAGAPMRQASRIYALLGMLLEGKTVAAREDAVTKAMGIMEGNYPDLLTVEQLAAKVGLERTYFSSLFKEKTGFSPDQYLTRLRIQKARLLLTETNHSIAQIAELVGLDPRNFSRLFKKFTGKSPLTYRKRQP